MKYYARFAQITHRGITFSGKRVNQSHSSIAESARATNLKSSAVTGRILFESCLSLFFCMPGPYREGRDSCADMFNSRRRNGRDSRRSTKEHRGENGRLLTKPTLRRLLDRISIDPARRRLNGDYLSPACQRRFGSDLLGQ